MSEELPTLPVQYQKPGLPGTVHAHPQQAKPLFKLMSKMSARPRLRSFGKHVQPIKKKKTIVYY